MYHWQNWCLILFDALTQRTNCLQQVLCHIQCWHPTAPASWPNLPNGLWPSWPPNHPYTLIGFITPPVSWCVLSVLAHYGCCHIIQVDAAHWWWMRRYPLTICKVLWVPRKALYTCNKLLLLLRHKQQQWCLVCIPVHINIVIYIYIYTLIYKLLHVTHIIYLITTHIYGL